jgi:transposase
VVDDAQLAALRVMVDRRRSLGEDRTGMIAQLHWLLLELIPGRTKRRTPPRPRARLYAAE